MSFISFASTDFTQRSSSTASRVLVCAGLLLVVSGCGVELIPELTADATRNTCENDSECGGGDCREGMCRTSSTQIPALLLDIVPPAGTPTPDGNPTIAGLNFTSVFSGFDQGPSGYEIELPHVSLVSGAVIASELSTESCLIEDEQEEREPGTDGSVPTRITLTPRFRLLGLPSPAITSTVETTSSVVGQPGETSYRAILNVPPGRYDIYAEPRPPIGGCVRPPFLALNQQLAAGSVNLRIELPVPELMHVTIRYPSFSNDLKEWVLDLVQKDSGRLISSRAVLSEPEETADGLEYNVDLAFSYVEGEAPAAANELVRLSPPDSAVAPILYLERSIVDLFQQGSGLIDQLTELASPVQFRGRVALSGSSTPIPATVTFVAVELASTNPGTVAAFSRSTSTDSDGYYELNLLPGAYRVLVEPSDESYGLKLAEIAVSDGSNNQTGRTIEVAHRHALSGRVVTFNGSAVAGAPLWADPVPMQRNLNLLQSAQGELSIFPIAVGQVTRSDGSFRLLADEGTYHVSARPEPSTGFAWGVRLGVEVAGTDTMRTLELPLPVVVKGRLISSDLGGVVPGALIRAYALLENGTPTADETRATSVVAVGESRVDSSGNFRLFLPSSFK